MKVQTCQGKEMPRRGRRKGLRFRKGLQDKAMQGRIRDSIGSMISREENHHQAMIDPQLRRGKKKETLCGGTPSGKLSGDKRNLGGAPGLGGKGLSYRIASLGSTRHRLTEDRLRAARLST